MEGEEQREDRIERRYILCIAFSLRRTRVRRDEARSREGIEEKPLVSGEYNSNGISRVIEARFLAALVGGAYRDGITHPLLTLASGTYPPLL